MNKQKHPEFDFQKYYNFSVFVNRYALVLWSFVVSILIMFVFGSRDYKVIAYDNKNTGIVKDILKSKEVMPIWDNTKAFNSKSSYIKADVLLTKSFEKDWNLNLWVWIFHDKFWIPYPMNISIDSKTNFKTKQKSLENYVSTLKSSSALNKNISKPNITVMSEYVVLNNYNLSCINTYLNWTIFCNTNKNALLWDLLQKKSMDIEPSFYKTLFNNLALSDNQKCNILKKIYNKKYNLDKIRDVVKSNKSCSLSEFERIDDFLNYVVFWSDEDLFRISSKISNNYSVLSSKLIQQLYVLLNQKDVPDYMMNNSYNFVRELIKSWNMDSTLAYITKAVYNDIRSSWEFRKKTSYSSLSAWMSSVINWDKVAWIAWLDSMIKDRKMLASLENKNEKLLHWAPKSTVSEREKIINIFRRRYSKSFTPTKKISYDDRKKTAHIEWDLHLNFNVWGKIDRSKVRISFDIKNIVWTNFDIYNLNFLDSKIAWYISNIAKPDTKTLISLQEDLQWKLYWPLINKNFWWSRKIDVCKKYIDTKWKFICSNSRLSINIESKQALWLTVYAHIDDSLNIRSLSLNKNSIKFKRGDILQEDFDINLWVLSRYLTILNEKKKLNVKDASSIKKIVEHRVKQYIDQENTRRSWLSKQEAIWLNSKVKKYFWTDLLLVRKLWNYYRLYFNLKWETFFLLYDMKSNNIIRIAIYKKDRKKTFLFKNISIRFSDIDLEKLNNFKSNPLKYLKSRDIDTYKTYSSYLEKNK